MANVTGGAACITWIIVASVLATGCSSLGPGALHESRLQYNETVKASSEEELLLNIVRLRYTDTPSSLADVEEQLLLDRKSTRLNSSHGYISYAVFCLKKKKKHTNAKGLEHT